MEIDELLGRIADELQQHGGDHADWLREVAEVYATAPEEACSMLNSKRMWGGAGSVANEALADNPGWDEISWAMHIREFRQLMIDLAEHLKSRPRAYPDIDFWLSAYISWNQSEV